MAALPPHRPLLRIHFFQDGPGRTVVKAAGEIDLSTRRALRRALLLAIHQRRGGLVAVDMTRLSFIDASGISALLECRQEARSAHVELTLEHPSPFVYRVLDLVGLLDLFSVKPRHVAAEVRGGRARPADPTGGAGSAGFALSLVPACRRGGGA